MRQQAYPAADQYLGRVIAGETVVEAKCIGVGLYRFVTDDGAGVRTTHEVSM